MSGIVIIVTIIAIIVALVLVMFDAFMSVMVSMGNAGVSTSKIISDLFKKKADKNKLKEEGKPNQPESLDKEMADGNNLALFDTAKVSATIKRWRLAAGILMGVLMMFFLRLGEVTK